MDRNRSEISSVSAQNPKHLRFVLSHVSLEAVQPRQQIQALINRHYASIRRAALAMSGDPWEADELAQETFVVAIERLNQFRGHASEATWLYSICLRLHRSRLRAASRRFRRAVRWFSTRSTGNLSDAGFEPPQQWIDEEQVQQLWRLVRRLPVVQRQAIVLRYVESMSIADAAKAAGCAEGTMKSRLHHAQRKLRGWLTAAEEPDASDAYGSEPTAFGRSAAADEPFSSDPPLLVSSSSLSSSPPPP